MGVSSFCIFLKSMKGDGTMKKELEIQLKKEFPFLNHTTDSGNATMYQSFGCECSDGWYPLLHDLCQAITERYQKEGEPVDLIVLQIKEKFASLHFYYTYADTPAHSKSQTLRSDIRQIIEDFEDKSTTVCELCGKSGAPRMDLLWKRTLCDACYGNFLKSKSRKSPSEGFPSA